MTKVKATKAWITAPLDASHDLKAMLESNLDPMGMFAPILHAQIAWMLHPQELTQKITEVSGKLYDLNVHNWRRMIGLPSEDVEVPHADDTRFSAPIWTESAPYDFTKQWYLACTHHIQDMLYETPGLSSKDRRRSAFWWRKWLNAIAPTNFLMLNPIAMQKAIESNGESLKKGFKNFLTDLKEGAVSMASPEDFTVGKDLATTSGKVVFRNELLEIIHYTPTQPSVYATPIVIITPWINKFYVLDLVPKKSMMKFLLEQGFDVFVTSWKNPGVEERAIRFEDYLIKGIDTIARVACEISGAPAVHAAGYCIGGTALITYLAWANRHYTKDAQPIKSATLFTTLVDFHKPGDIEVFLDEASYQFMARNIERKGYLDGKEMASAFRLLRSNSLIWNYAVSNYLYGEKPAPFDVLYWNMDSTRMPAAMHIWYLRELYIHNNLIRPNVLELAGERIDLTCIHQPLYAVGAVDDHIAPWKQAYAINAHVPGDKRFVLSSSGHILGIVNPVVTPPKREYWVAKAERHEKADEWREHAEHHLGSWWEDWMSWLKPQSGKKRPAPEVATKSYPVLCDAPGTYVLER